MFLIMTEVSNDRKTYFSKKIKKFILKAAALKYVAGYQADIYPIFKQKNFGNIAVKTPMQ